MRAASGQLPRWVFGLLMAAGSVFISWGSIDYLIEGEVHSFILDKGRLFLPGVFVWALQIHVSAAAFALPACLALSSRRIMRRMPRVHRWLGRLTGAVVLLALVPSGSWLAFSAKGGAVSTVGFLLSGGIVLVSMVQAIRTARGGDFVAHRRYTAHVLAQLSVAVTSRAMLVAFSFAPINDDLAYLLALWLPVLASAFAVERLLHPHLLSRRNDEAPRVHPLQLDPAR